MIDPANEAPATPEPTPAEPAPLVAHPFTGFETPAPRVRAAAVDVLRVIGAYGGSAVAGLLLLTSTMVHRPGHGAPASAMVEQVRAREQARVAAAQALHEADQALAEAHVRR